MSTFLTAIVPLAAPVTLQVPGGSYPRPRVITSGEPVETVPLTLVELDVAFWVSPLTRQIHAQIARIPTALLIYGPQDFAEVVSDLAEYHAQRLLQVLGNDPAERLQRLIDRKPMPPLPQRVPRQVAAWQAKAVLEAAGLLPQVEALIASVPNEDALVIRRAWQDNAPLPRHGATVLSLSAALGLTSEQLDSMFIQAAVLHV